MLAGPLEEDDKSSLPLPSLSFESAVASLRFCFSSYSFLTLSISDRGTGEGVGEAGALVGVAVPEAGAGRAKPGSSKWCLHVYKKSVTPSVARQVVVSRWQT